MEAPKSLFYRFLISMANTLLSFNIYGKCTCRFKLQSSEKYSFTSGCN